MFDGFGIRLEELMKTQNMSNKQITEELNLSKNIIGNCKKGEIPNTKTMYLISQKLGVTMEYLLTGNSSGKYTNEEQQIINAYNRAGQETKNNIKAILSIEDERCDL